MVHLKFAKKAHLMCLTNHTQHIVIKRVGDTLGGVGDVYNLDGDDAFIDLLLSLNSSSCIQ